MTCACRWGTARNVVPFVPASRQVRRKGCDHVLMRLPSRPGSAECDGSRLEKGAVPGRARMQRWLHAAQRGPAALGEGRNVLASAESSPSKSLAKVQRIWRKEHPLACL